MKHVRTIVYHCTNLVIISNMCFFSSRGFSDGVSFRTSAILGRGVEETLPWRLAGLMVPTKWATLDFLRPALCPSCSRARSEWPWVRCWLLIQEMNMSLNQSKENWYMTSIWARSARTKYRVAPLVATYKIKIKGMRVLAVYFGNSARYQCHFKTILQCKKFLHSFLNH